MTRVMHGSTDAYLLLSLCCRSPTIRRRVGIESGFLTKRNHSVALTDTLVVATRGQS